MRSGLGSAPPGKESQEMNFSGTGQTLSGDDFSRAAVSIGCEEAVIRAVTLVEARGSGFDAKQRPIMLAEPHVFYRNLPREKRAAAVAAGLAYPKWRPGNYPATQDARYQILDRMIAIDEAAALAACSWGIGQVLGENFRMCSFASPQALVKKCLEGEGGQLDVMVSFIKAANLGKFLRAKDWAGFARGYNGSGYAKNKYDEKLADAYVRISKGSPTSHDPLSDGLLSEGDKGEIVATLQRALGIHADGDFGPLTTQALVAFQSAHGLVADGKVGRLTAAALGLPYWGAIPSPKPAPSVKPPVIDAVPAPGSADDTDRRASLIADIIMNLCAALSALFKGARK